MIAYFYKRKELKEYDTIEGESKFNEKLFRKEKSSSQYQRIFILAVLKQPLITVVLLISQYPRSFSPLAILRDFQSFIKTMTLQHIVNNASSYETYPVILIRTKMPQVQRCILTNVDFWRVTASILLIHLHFPSEYLIYSLRRPSASEIQWRMVDEFDAIIDLIIYAHLNNT